MSRRSGSHHGKAKRPRAGSNGSAAQPTSSSSLSLSTRSTGDVLLVPLALKSNDGRWLWPEKYLPLLKAYHDHMCPAEAAEWSSTHLTEPTTAELAQNLNTAAIPYITKPQATALLIAAGKWPAQTAVVADPDDASTAPSSSSSSSSFSSSSSSTPSPSSSSSSPSLPLANNTDPPLGGVPPPASLPLPPSPRLASRLRAAAHAARSDKDRAARARRHQRRIDRRVAKAARAADRERRRREREDEDNERRSRQRQHDDERRRDRSRERARRDCRNRSRSHDRGPDHKSGGGGSSSSSSSSASTTSSQTLRRSPSPVRPDGPLSGSYSRFMPRILSTRLMASDAILNMPSSLTDRTKRMCAAFMFVDSSDFLAGERAADGIHIGTDGTHTVRNRRAPFNSSEDASFMFDCWSRTIRACWPNDTLLLDELTKYTLYIGQLFKRLTPLGVYLVDHRWRSIACMYRCSVWPMLPEVAVAIAFIAATHSRDVRATGLQCVMCAGPHAVADCHTHVGIDMSGLFAASKSSLISSGSSSSSSSSRTTGRSGVSSGTASGVGSRGRGAPRPPQKPDSCDHFNSSRGCKYHDSKCSYTHKCGKCGTHGHSTSACKVKGK